MKTLKLSHELAQQVLQGVKTSTWRIYDDKDLRVDDKLQIVDKVDPKDPSSWEAIGVATITVVIEKHLENVKDTDYDGHRAYKTVEEAVQDMRSYYGPEVTGATPVKIIHFSFHPYGSDVKNNPLPLIEAKLYADGGSRGNPGPSGSGFVLLDMDDKVVVKKGEYLGVTTNNQAEYHALKFGLEEALKHNVRTLHVFMDSLLVVNQMRGIFKVKNRDLWPIHEAAKELASRFRKITFSHVPRELNKLADSAANDAMDQGTAKE